MYKSLTNFISCLKIDGGKKRNKRSFFLPLFSALQMLFSITIE